jgi:hypothetical protein
VEAAPQYHHQQPQQQAPISSAPQHIHHQVQRRQQQLHGGTAASLSQLEQRNQEIEAQMHRWTGRGSTTQNLPGATPGLASGPSTSHRNTTGSGFHMVYSGAPEFSSDRRGHGGTQPGSARADVERSSTMYRLEQLATMHESGLSSPVGGRRPTNG